MPIQRRFTLACREKRDYVEVIRRVSVYIAPIFAQMTFRFMKVFP